MELKLTDIERSLVRQSLMDTIVNSNNFSKHEKDHLIKVYHQIREYEEEHDSI